MTGLSAEVREKLRRPVFWHLVTLNRDGSPQVKPVWAEEADGRVLVNTGRGWRKERNVRRDPRVALSMIEPGNPYERVEIQGRVIDFIEGDAADRQLDQLAKRYLGTDVYPWRSGEERVILVIEPTNVIHHVDTDDPGVLPVA
jgi:PPOX class probable F420-dependent enzyme